MKSIPITKLDQYLNGCVDLCSSEGPLVFTRDGKSVAVLLTPADEDEVERLVLAYSPRFQAMLEKSRQSIREGRGLSHDEFWQAVEARHKSKRKAKSAAASTRIKAK